MSEEGSVNRLRLEEALRAALGSGGAEGTARFQAAIEAIARAFGARTVTLHRKRPGEEVLELVASRGLPEKLIPSTRAIPFGKGMAGLCAVRREPVMVCNLQTDSSGVARPAARETGVAGAVVVPIVSGGGELVGTLGIGKTGEHAYAAEEMALLGDCARAFAAALVDAGAAGR